MEEKFFEHVIALCERLTSRERVQLLATFSDHELEQELALRESADVPYSPTRPFSPPSHVSYADTLAALANGNYSPSSLSVSVSDDTENPFLDEDANLPRYFPCYHECDHPTCEEGRKLPIVSRHAKRQKHFVENFVE
jgi:hypothetical protein